MTCLPPSSTPSRFSSDDETLSSESARLKSVNEDGDADQISALRAPIVGEAKIIVSTVTVMMLAAAAPRVAVGNEDGAAKLYVNPELAATAVSGGKITAAPVLEGEFIVMMKPLLAAGPTLAVAVGNEDGALKLSVNSELGAVTVWSGGSWKVLAASRNEDGAAKLLVTTELAALTVWSGGYSMLLAATPRKETIADLGERVREMDVSVVLVKLVCDANSLSGEVVL